MNESPRGRHAQKILAYTTPAGAGREREYVLECRCGWDTGPAPSFRETVDRHREHFELHARASPS